MSLDPLRRVAQDVLAPERVAAAIEALFWIVLITLAAWLALRISLGVIRKTAAWRPAHPADRMAPILEGLLRYAIIFTALLLVLAVLRVNIAPVLASATVIGLTVGFGAQYIIRDVLAGLFLISEGIVRTGDLVRVDADAGIVERVTLRITQLRKFSGELVTVPNGSIGRIANLSRDYARAVVEITIPYTASPGEALAALEEAARDFRAARPEARRDAPQIDGITDLRDLGFVVQCSLLTAPGEQYAAAAELRARALDALARRRITPGAAAPPAASPAAPARPAG
jgi:small-conductance mechanosensitive channel